MEQKAKKSGAIKIIAAAGLLVVIALAVFFMINRQKDEEPSETTTFAMGSYIQQTVYGDDAEDACKNGAQAVNTLESLISWKIEGSDVYNINLNAGKDWTEVSATTASIISQALDVCKNSDGALDITVLPLSRLWDFDDSPTAPPSDEDIQKFLPFVDYTALRYDEENSSFSFKSSEYGIDLGAVGKGAACDVIISEYKALDVDRAIVAVGGSIGTYGEKPNGDKWNVALRDPNGGDPIGVIAMGEGFCSTSGSYEKYFEYDGKTYHHILDTKTGYPVETDVVSVTVLCSSGVLSDSLSTACFSLGWEESQSLLENYNAEAIFVWNDGTIRLTDGIKDSFSLTDAGKEAYTIAED